MKSLKNILLLYKIVRIVLIVCFAAFIAGIVGCAIGAGVLHLVADVSFNDTSIRAELLKNGITLNMAYTYLAVGALGCAINAFLSLYVAFFVKKVLDEGTPFTRPLLKEMRRVALVDIIVNIGGAILVGIAFGIAKAFDKSMGDFHNYGAFSIALGLWMLITSLFIEYPIEKEEQSIKEIAVEPANEEKAE